MRARHRTEPGARARLLGSSRSPLWFGRWPFLQTLALQTPAGGERRSVFPYTRSDAIRLLAVSPKRAQTTRAREDTADYWPQCEKPTEAPNPEPGRFRTASCILLPDPHNGE